MENFILCAVPVIRECKEKENLDRTYIPAYELNTEIYGL